MASNNADVHYKPGDKRSEISSTPSRPLEPKKHKCDVRIPLGSLDDVTEGSEQVIQTGQTLKLGLSRLVEDTVKNAFEKQGLLELARDDTGISKPLSLTDEAGLAVVINNVMSAIQPLIMQAVSAAIVSSTSAVIEKLNEITEDYKEEKRTVQIVKVEVQHQRSEQDKLEQYSRIDNVKIFGLEENENEILEDKIIELGKVAGVEMKKEDISVCHRLPRGRGGHRPTIVKFVRRTTKANLMQSKQKLKGNPQYKDVFIVDDLTSLRSKILRELKEDPNILRVWSRDGKIHCVIEVDKREEKVIINSAEDVRKLGWDDKRLQDIGVYLEV